MVFHHHHHHHHHPDRGVTVDSDYNQVRECEAIDSRTNILFISFYSSTSIELFEEPGTTVQEHIDTNHSDGQEADAAGHNNIRFKSFLI